MIFKILQIKISRNIKSKNTNFVHLTWYRVLGALESWVIYILFHKKCHIYLNSMVSMISHENIIIVVNSNASWIPDLSIIFTTWSKMTDKLSILIKYLNMFKMGRNEERELKSLDWDLKIPRQSQSLEKKRKSEKSFKWVKTYQRRTTSLTA